MENYSDNESSYEFDEAGDSPFEEGDATNEAGNFSPDKANYAITPSGTTTMCETWMPREIVRSFFYSEYEDGKLKSWIIDEVGKFKPIAGSYNRGAIEHTVWQGELEESERRKIARDPRWEGIKARIRYRERSAAKKRADKINGKGKRLFKDGMPSDLAHAVATDWMTSQDETRFRTLCIELHAEYLGLDPRSYRRRVRAESDSMAFVLAAVTTDPDDETEVTRAVSNGIDAHMNKGYMWPEYFAIALA